MSGYIGNIPTPQATQSRQSFTATAGQTTFATSGYTAGFIDVYLNGVHLLDGTDYTATNGSDIVLTTGAALDDVVEFVAYETFSLLDQSFTGTTTTDVLTTTGAFTSLGIDDNATSTAMTLDASGNVLVGTTNSNIVSSATATDEGFVYVNGAALTAARSAGQVADFNRITNDGEIVRLRKDGTTVGSIGTFGGASYYGGPSGGLMFNGVNINPTNGTSARTDGTNDIGNGAYRFKDLYLSGGVYLGGTGAANKLDDYEEGTWTPTFSVGSFGSILNFTYTKIGRVVFITGYLTAPSGLPTSGTLSIGGLPFSGNTNFNMAQLWYASTTNATFDAVAYLSGGSTSLVLRPMNGTPSQLSELSVQMTYLTT